MKFLHALVSLILLVLIVSAGAGTAYAAFSGVGLWDAFAGFLPGNRLVAGGAGIALVLLALLWVLTLTPSRDKTRFLSFENPGGEVRIGLDAIRDFLARLSGEFPAVVSMKPVVRTRGTALIVDVQCRIKAGSPLPEITRQLQERIRQSIEGRLGLSEIQTVKVTVKEIVGSASGAKTRVEAEVPSAGANGGEPAAAEGAPPDDPGVQ